MTALGKECLLIATLSEEFLLIAALSKEFLIAALSEEFLLTAARSNEFSFYSSSHLSREEKGDADRDLSHIYIYIYILHWIVSAGIKSKIWSRTRSSADYSSRKPLWSRFVLTVEINKQTMSLQVL